MRERETDRDSQPPKNRPPNRLAGETSPYLLQHAFNPVNWFPWGEQALEKARQEDRPILLSIGYSSCHWCHVMERESFEDEELARLMNEKFVNIKVDREERPDLDSIYMNFVQMTTGSGGWPLTVFLTPEQLPFFGGTYFPPEDRYGRPGFRTVLKRVSDFYQHRRQKILEDRLEITRRLEKSLRLETSSQQIQPDLLEQGFYALLQQADTRHGGFGQAPKFPASFSLAFLLRFYARRQTPSALDVVQTSLDAMAQGGIHDQLGGGFHRYSVDDRWLVPHFEKMLYDNALLARVYLEAWQVTGAPLYRRTAEGILEYVRRDLAHPEGGFYSAEDADSEGEEGKFYVWTRREVDGLLQGREAELFREYYDVTEHGNWEGKNILNRRFEHEAFARRHQLTVDQLDGILEAARKKLLKARQSRVRPGLDDKILASWNGLMLTAFVKAAFALDNPTFLELALGNARFLKEKMIRNGRLFRSWKQGEARHSGFLDDYAHVIEGFLALYQVSGRLEWLQQARSLMETQIQLFYDSQHGDFYFTSSEQEALLVRPKEYFDNAIPCGNSTSALNLMQLAVLSGEEAYRRMAERLLRKMVEPISRFPSSFGNWLAALDFFLNPADEIVLVGPEDGRNRLLQPLRRKFLPGKVMAMAVEVSPELAQEVPLFSGKQVIGNQATAYVCRNYACQNPACQNPVTTAEELEELLSTASSKD